MLLTLSCFHGSVQANMRAPYSEAYSGSGEIHSSIEGLVVMKEVLDFDCDFPYRGSLDEVRRMVREVRTSATYWVMAQNAMPAGFDFILTVERPVVASINGDLAVSGAPIMLKELSGKGWSVPVDSRYKVSFSGGLRAGLNTINVQYVQPMGVDESFSGIYPFFMTSRFASHFSYDLSPLREWVIDDAFTMKVRISFKDNTGWLKALTGSDYRVRIFGWSKEKAGSGPYDYPGRTRLEIPISNSVGNSDSGDIREFQILFRKDFPDTLETRIDY